MHLPCYTVRVQDGFNTDGMEKQWAAVRWHQCTPAAADGVPELQAYSADGAELLGHDREHGAISNI